MPRYAIYYMPPPKSQLWTLGSSCLGYDASTGCNVSLPAHSIYSDQGLALKRTQQPRHYGFHATLKAPFYLKSGVTEADLVEAAGQFAKVWQAFDLPTLYVQSMGDFIAFSPRGRSRSLHTFADACVADFEPFRAQLSNEDFERRKAGGLTPRQTHFLSNYGYPFVFDDFRFHMTLSGPLDLRVQQTWLEGLREIFANVTQPVRCDSLAIFKQNDPDSRFQVLTRLALRSCALG